MYNTTAESISGFMSWASQRIAKEVEENERVEQEANTREFVPGSNNDMKSYYLSDDEKIKIIRAFDHYRDRGARVETIAKAVEIHQTTYHRWRKELGIPKYKKPKAL